MEATVSYYCASQMSLVSQLRNTSLQPQIEKGVSLDFTGDQADVGGSFGSSMCSPGVTTEDLMNVTPASK